MSEPAIRLCELSKAYRVWAEPKDLLIETLTGRTRHREFQALSDISFDVPKGSVVGLLGRNGAGKSTLLRIVAGTLDATHGSVKTNGRIAAILELGTGFHPDYTGRENVFLGGMCLGLSRKEIESRFEEIVDFAELWEFIDQPFRTYSSGMQARLTFSVATSIDPDILIIDEALGVGDARFQLKSFDRIRRFKEEGKSILLVSHNIAQIVAICDRAILLERGTLIRDGDPNEVGKLFHEMLFAPTDNFVELASRPELADQVDCTSASNFDINDATGIDDGKSPDRAAVAVVATETKNQERRYGLRQVEVRSVRLVDDKRRTVRALHSLDEYLVALTLAAKQNFDQLTIGFIVRDVRGIEIFGWDTANAKTDPVGPIKAEETREVSIRFRANLAAGHYFLTVAVAEIDKTKQDVRFDCLEFSVNPTPHIFSSSLVNLDAKLARSHQ